MKIGILTFHCAHNYGAVLQAYALQTYLNSIGNNVCIVNYRPKYIKNNIFAWYKWISLNPIKTYKKICWQRKTLIYQWKKRYAFKHFEKKYLNVKNINLSLSKNNIDCFIFGSDQIWRKSHNCFDPIYYGNFKGCKDKLLVSYAASMGLSTLSTNEKLLLKKWLSSFSMISVRESYLKELLLPLTSENIEIVVDPTFLLSKTSWEQIAISPNIDKQYILIYQVICNSSTYKMAYEVAKKFNLEIIEISSDFVIKDVDHKVIYDASPEEFLGWIKNANFIITTSFHGTAFSLIFNKPFISIKQNMTSDLRIESILSMCGQEKRFVNCNNIKWLSIYEEKPNVD